MRKQFMFFQFSRVKTFSLNSSRRSNIFTQPLNSIFRQKIQTQLNQCMLFSIIPFDSKFSQINIQFKSIVVIQYLFNQTSKLLWLWMEIRQKYIQKLYIIQNITYLIQMALPSNSLKQGAELYLRKHRIIQLMQDLCSDLCFEQPQNINEFLIQRLKQKQKQGFKIGIFSKQEISNIFVLFDLKREGFIDKQRCKQALKTLANNQFQFDQVNLASLPDKVDEKAFVSLCQKVLGVK